MLYILCYLSCGETERREEGRWALSLSLASFESSSSDAALDPAPTTTLLSQGFGRGAIVAALGSWDEMRLSIVRIPGSVSPACTAFATRAKSTDFGASSTGAPKGGGVHDDDDDDDGVAAAEAPAGDGSGVREVPLLARSDAKSLGSVTTVSALDVSSSLATATTAAGAALFARLAFALSACSWATHVLRRLTVSSI